MGQDWAEITQLRPVQLHSLGANISISAYGAYTLENNNDIFSVCLVLVFIPPNTQLYASNARC